MRSFPWCFGILLFFISLHVKALFIESTNVDVFQDERVRYLPIINESDGKKSYLVTIFKVDNPKKTESMVPVRDGLFLYSPHKLVLEPGNNSGFKFYYLGPTDNVEKYYIVRVTEVPVNIDLLDKKDSVVSVDMILSVELNVIIKPSKIDFRYDFSNGKITNNGNSYFKYISSDGCSDRYKYSKYILPGESIEVEEGVSEANRMILHSGEVVKVTSCK